MTDRRASHTAPVRVLMAGGTTGGHLFPGLAVAQEVTSRGGEVLFVGTAGGLEARKVPAYGYRLEVIEAEPLKRVGLRTRLRSMALLPKAVWHANRIIKTFQPDVGVGLGGFVSGPVMMAAWLRRVPVVLLEQNTVPGMTNRLLSRIAKKVVVAFPHAADRLPSKSIEPLGNPVRRSIVEALAGPRAPSAANGKATLLILGGSQGAVALNELMMGAAQGLSSANLRIIHQTGQADAERVRTAYRDAGIDARVEPFFDDMVEVYRQSDIAVCRAGATTIAELAVAGLPALLVPFPFATDNHQMLNAQAVAESGGAVVLPQRELTGEKLGNEIRKLADDEERRRSMSEAMRSFGKPEAAETVATLLEQVAKGRGD